VAPLYVENLLMVKNCKAILLDKKVNFTRKRENFGKRRKSLNRKEKT